MLAKVKVLTSLGKMHQRKSVESFQVSGLVTSQRAEALMVEPFHDPKIGEKLQAEFPWFRWKTPDSLDFQDARPFCFQKGQSSYLRGPRCTDRNMHIQGSLFEGRICSDSCSFVPSPILWDG